MQSPMTEVQKQEYEDLDDLRIWAAKQAAMDAIFYEIARSGVRAIFQKFLQNVQQQTRKIKG